MNRKEESCYWFGTVEAPSFSVSELAERSDIVIVGAGMSGLSTAYHLLRLGRNVLVIDRGRVARGASGRNTGMMTSEIKKEYASVIADDGLETAKELLSLVRRAIDGIARAAEDEDIDCGFSRVESLYLAEGPRTEAALEEEAKAASSLGIECETLGSERIAEDYPSVRATRMLRKKGEASMDPYAFCIGLARTVIRMGGIIAEGVTYLGHTENAGGTAVRTDRGIVRADRLCLCSDADLDRRLPVPTPVIPTWESVIVTKPFPGSVSLPSRGELIWNAFSLFEYARIVEGNRIMIGSERTIRVRGEAPPPDPGATLSHALHDVFDVPEIGIDHLWTGQVSVTDDWKPYADRISERVLVCGGYNGHGLTLGFLSGEILAARIQELSHPHEKIFAYPHNEDRIGKALYRYSPSSLRGIAVRAQLWRYRFSDLLERLRP